MDEEFKDPVRVKIQGHDYILWRNRTVDGRMADPRNVSLGQVLTRFILADADKPEHFIGGIIFYETILTSFDYGDHDSYGKDSDSLGFALANLLPYLDLDMPRLLESWDNGQHLLAIIFDKGKSGYTNNLKQTYTIETKDGLFATARNLVFPDGYNKEVARRKILEILMNHQEEHPTTNMPYVELLSSLPITEKEALGILHFLREEDKIDILTQPADASKFVSLRIKSGGVEELNGNLHSGVQSTQVTENYTGTVFKNTTTGPNSPIIITVDEIHNTIGGLIKEAETRGEPETVETLKVLEGEVKDPKDVSKIKTLFEGLKKTAAWTVGTLTPIVTQVVTEAALKQFGLK